MPYRFAFLPLPAAGAALLAAVVYLNALDNPFVYDDFRLIVENPSITDLSNLQAIIVRDITRPVVNLSYALDTALWGARPFGYHITNVILHALNVILVYWVVLLASGDRRRQSGQRVGSAAEPGIVAFAAAALFALHPMMTQAVGYIASRSEVMYSAFFLVAFLAGRQWLLTAEMRWWLACTTLWLVAMFTKETAAMLSFVLLGYDWLVLDTDPATRRRRFLGLGLPLLSITFAGGAGRLAVLQIIEYPEGMGLDWRYVLVTVEAFWQYLGLFFVPRGQTIFHAVTLPADLLSLRGVAPVAALAGFIALIWWLRRVHSLVAFGLLWFALLLVPSALLFVLGRGEPMAEHRAYLSGAGLFLTWACGFGLLWARPRQRRLILATAGALLLAQFGVQTVLRNVVWDDPVVLSREAVAHAPGHWMPRILLAEALRQGGRCGEAVPEYRAAIAARPGDEFPYARLAGCLMEDRRLDEAMGTMEQLRAVNPHSQEALMGLGIFALLGGDVERSREHFGAVDRGPARARAQTMLAFLDGALPPAEHERLCHELEMVGGRPLPIDGCLPNAQKDAGDPTAPALN